MFTIDDVLFSILQSCCDSLDSNKLVYYVYIYQVAGLNYKFRYKIDASGLSCSGINNLLSQVINDGNVTLNNGIISLTSRGSSILFNTPMTAEEWDFIEDIKSTLDKLSEKELQALCITDMIVYDTLQRYGVDGLIKQENRIKSSIRAICSNDFKDEDFDASLKFLRKVRKRHE